MVMVDENSSLVPMEKKVAPPSPVMESGWLETRPRSEACRARRELVRSKLMHEAQQPLTWQPWRKPPAKARTC